MLFVYLLSFIAIVIATFLLYKGLKILFRERKKTIKMPEDDQRHVNSR